MKTSVLWELPYRAPPRPGRPRETRHFRHRGWSGPESGGRSARRAAQKHGVSERRFAPRSGETPISGSNSLISCGAAPPAVQICSVFPSRMARGGPKGPDPRYCRPFSQLTPPLPGRGCQHSRGSGARGCASSILLATGPSGRHAPSARTGTPLGEYSHFGRRGSVWPLFARFLRWRGPEVSQIMGDLCRTCAPSRAPGNPARWRPRVSAGSEQLCRYLLHFGHVCGVGGADRVKTRHFCTAGCAAPS